MLRICEIKDRLKSFKTRHVLITGGEPLLQRETPQLVEELKQDGYLVSIETHGEISIEKVAPIARIIMDIKTPSSGMNRGGYQKNLGFLKPTDEIKFVIASKEDYFWAKEIVESGLPELKAVLFSPAVQALEAPGEFPGVSYQWLAERILEDCLPVRFQLQIHKHIWGPHRLGV